MVREITLCKGCAFKPGTEAHNTAWTRLVADLCVYAAHPFYCHCNRDLETGKVLRGEERLCAGFVNAMTRLDVSPTEERRRQYYEAMALVQRAFDAGDRYLLMRLVEQVRRFFPEVADATCEPMPAYLCGPDSVVKAIPESTRHE